MEEAILAAAVAKFGWESVVNKRGTTTVLSEGVSVSRGSTLVASSSEQNSEFARLEIFCGRGFLRGCSGSSKSKVQRPFYRHRGRGREPFNDDSMIVCSTSHPLSGIWFFTTVSDCSVQLVHHC